MKYSIDKINHYCLLVLTSVALIGILIYTKSVLMPLVISVFSYAVLYPVMNMLKERFKLGHFLSVSLVLLIVTLFGVLLSYFFVVSFNDFFESALIYRDRVIDFSLKTGEWLGDFGIVFDSETIANRVKSAPLLSIVGKTTGNIFELLGLISLVLIFFAFMISSKNTKPSGPITKEIYSQVNKYVVTKVFTSVITGIFIGIFLLFINVEMALIFGVLTFLLNFIPNIGSVIATVLPLPVILLQYGMRWEFVTFLILAGGVQFFVGNVLEPKILGESMDLHPITVMVFLVFWGLVWGISGMFLAVPITAVLKIILSKIPTTQKAADLLAGRFNF